MAKLGARLGLTRYDADEHYRQALDYYRRRNLEQALLHIGLALQLYPYHAEYHAAQGLFYLEDGIHEKATAAFEAALRLNTYEPLAHYGLGALAYQRKAWPDALHHFQQAWAAQPERAETLYYLALTTHHLGDNAKAQAWMRQAQAAFDQQDAKRPSRDAAKWLAEFDKLLRR